jgi:hypothetical protein
MLQIRPHAQVAIDRIRQLRQWTPEEIRCEPYTEPVAPVMKVGDATNWKPWTSYKKSLQNAARLRSLNQSS